LKSGKRTIGILGGMGPEATADLYMRIVRIFQRQLHARYDKDYPPMLIFSVPIPDIVERVENEEATISYLKYAARTLESAGADFISIPCNTAHAYIDAIRSAVKIPVLSMIEATANEISTAQSPVGLLATTATVHTKVYENEFGRRHIGLVLPTQSEQASLTEVILNVLGRTDQSAVKEKLGIIIDGLKMRGARAIVLGCTELPLVMSSGRGIELIDPTEILARRCVTLSITSSTASPKETR
jgi:aspartate racemase